MMIVCLCVGGRGWFSCDDSALPRSPQVLDSGVITDADLCSLPVPAGDPAVKALRVSEGCW